MSCDDSDTFVMKNKELTPTGIQNDGGLLGCVLDLEKVDKLYMLCSQLFTFSCHL